MKNDYSWRHQADEPLSLASQLSLQNSSNTLICPQRHRRITLITISRACNPLRRRSPEIARTFNTIFLILNLLLVTTPLAYSQAQQSQSDQSIKLNTELVVLDAQVLNKKTGRVVGSLSLGDFTLYEDGAKQQITHFSQDKLPLSIVLLLDISGSVWPVIDQIQDGGLRALRRLKPNDEVAIMAFDTEAVVIQNFTKDRQLIADKIVKIDEMKSILHNARQKPADGTHIADSIYQAANHLLKAANPIGNRIIIVVSDNQPEETWIAHSKSEVVNQLFESGVSVYGLITEAGYKPSKLVKAVDYFPSVWLARKLGLLKTYNNKGGRVDIYSDYTGGIVFDGRKKKAEEKLIELIELIRSRYSFGYVSLNQKQDGKLRKIEMKISPNIESREGKLAILTRKGYYARKRNSKSNTPQKSHRFAPRIEADLTGEGLTNRFAAQGYVVERLPDVLLRRRQRFKRLILPHWFAANSSAPKENEKITSAPLS